MGWRRIGPDRWALLPDHPGARWLPDDDPTIGWNKPKPIYLEVEPVDEDKLAIDIVATRGAIRGFEYMIATVPTVPTVELVPGVAIDICRYAAKRWMQTNLLWDRRITITVRNGVYTEEFCYANWVSFCELDAWYPGRLGRRQHLVVYSDLVT